MMIYAGPVDPAWLESGRNIWPESGAEGGGRVTDGAGGQRPVEGVADQPARRRMPSMADVAAMAGVSSQTVSRVANNRSNVDQETRRRVLAAMRVLGYRPNSAARALAVGRFGMLGVISFGLGAYGNARTLGAIVRAAQEAAYTVNVIEVRAQTESAVREAFDRLVNQAVDGIILVESQILDTPSLRLPFDLPVVVADGDVNHRYPVVDVDQAEGARRATGHLLDLGHRTVWHVTGPQDSYAARRRAESWHATLKDAAAPVPPLVFGDWSAVSGYAAGRRLAGDPDVTAIFAGNDQMALGVLRALHEAGRRVPEEISVVGFDDITEAACFIPPLTTVRQDFEQVGQDCVRMLLAQLGPQPAGLGSSSVIAPRLVLRASTAPPSHR